MEVNVDVKTGRRNREYRPYINREEEATRLNLYDPYHPRVSGLYDGPMPNCQSWQMHFLSRHPVVRYEKNLEFAYPDAANNIAYANIQFGDRKRR